MIYMPYMGRLGLVILVSADRVPVNGS